MRNITKDGIVLGIFIVVIVGVIIFFLNLAVDVIFGKLLDYNTNTQTEYVDCGDHSEIRYTDGVVIEIGNDKTEYENGEIGE